MSPAPAPKKPVGRPPGGGKTPGSGRKVGTKNKRTLGREAAIAGATFKGKSAVAFLAGIYQSKGKRWTDDQRIDAAKAVAPYQSPKLANVTMRGANDDGSMTFKLVLAGADATV